MNVKVETSLKLTLHRTDGFLLLLRVTISTLFLLETVSRELPIPNFVSFRAPLDPKVWSMPITTVLYRLVMDTFYSLILEMDICTLEATRQEVLRSCKEKLFAFHPTGTRLVKRQTVMPLDMRCDGG